MSKLRKNLKDAGERIKTASKKRSNRVFFVIVLALIILVSLTHKTEAETLTTTQIQFPADPPTDVDVKSYVDNGLPIPERLKTQVVKDIMAINKKAEEGNMTKDDRKKKKYFNSVISYEDKRRIRKQQKDIKNPKRATRRQERNIKKPKADTSKQRKERE